MEPSIITHRKGVALFILGTTGVGKSKLSLDLAEKLGGEIVNADSMQLYKGNEGVMTAKPTPEEKERVPHHMYDVVEMEVRDFNVNKYLDRALASIDEILSRGKLPIVVGGTNYYIEGLLFERSSQVQSTEFNLDSFDQAMNHALNTCPGRFKELISDFNTYIPHDNKAAIELKYEDV